MDVTAMSESKFAEPPVVGYAPRRNLRLHAPLVYNFFHYTRALRQAPKNESLRRFILAYIPI